MKKHNICIPVSPCMGKFGDGTELRYALRGLERHFQGEYEITLIGPKRPEWYEGAWLEQTQGRLKQAMRMAADAFPEGFFWWYDDCVLITDQTADELMVTGCREEWSRAQTSWGRKLERVRERLEKEGYVAWDYSRPHGPYWFDKGMIDEAFADWSKNDMIGKFPVESWILSKRNWPRRFGTEAQYYGPWKNPPAAGRIFVNWCDAGLTPELLAWLEREFPLGSIWERGAVKPLPKSGPRVRIHTLRYGTAWWLEKCVPTLERWAAKHGWPIRVWTDEGVNPAYPNPKFQEIDMLKEFLDSDDEWLFYIDADVWIHPEAPAHPELLPGMHMMPGPPSKFSRTWPQWVRRNLGRHDTRDWVYRNAGIWLCDRESAQKMLEVISEPFLDAVMEQHQWNLWACLAWKNGMPMHDLGEEWNSFSGRMAVAHFQHIAGGNKEKKWQRLKTAGIVWEVEALEPVEEIKETFELMKYPFDLHKYAISDDRGMAMDDRHIYMLYEAACSEWSGSRVAVEIGSYKGRSTTALIEALNQGKIDHLHVLEVSPTAELLGLLKKVNDPERVTLHRKPSWEVPITQADFVFIDGDHRWPALQDTLRALAWGAKVICMHDSQGWPLHKHCWGAWHAANTLKMFPDRTWVEDAKKRPGEWTHRGFLVSRAE